MTAQRPSLWERVRYRLPRLLLAIIAWLLRWLPRRLRRLGVRVVFTTATQQRPAAAMRELLGLEDELNEAINQVALRYDGGVHVKHRLMRYHDFFVERLGADERVLDLGCGYGVVAYSIASRTDAIVTGIDMSADHIALARQRFHRLNLTFVLGDVLRDLPAGVWDTIVFSNVLEHLERRVEFLTSVQRRLQPKRWLIRVPMINRDWRVPLRQELGLPHFSDATHFTEYTRESFEAEMRAAGLSILHLQIQWGELWAEVAARAPVQPSAAAARGGLAASLSPSGTG